VVGIEVFTAPCVQLQVDSQCKRLICIEGSTLRCLNVNTLKLNAVPRCRLDLGVAREGFDAGVRGELHWVHVQSQAGGWLLAGIFT
jgi:hypothetical protein